MRIDHAPAAALLPLVFVLLSSCGESTPEARVDGRTQEAWLAHLEDSDARQRAQAIEALARFEDPPVDRIATRLDDHRVRARLAAIRALGDIGAPAAAHAGRLATYLEEDPEGFDPEQAGQLRQAAMEALGKMGSEGFKAVRHLLASREARSRARATYTIRPLLPNLEDGVRVLLPLAEDESWVVRREAVRGLGFCGKGDERASKALMAALEDDRSEVVQSAAMALGDVQGRADREGRALADMLYAPHTGVRAAVVYALGKMGEEASPYRKAVRDLLENDPKLVVRIQAALAYWRIAGDTKPALPVVEQGLKSKDKGLCRDALKAVAGMGADAAGALPLILPMVEDRDLRQQAVSALGSIGPAAEEALPLLRKTAEAVGEDESAFRAQLTEAIEAIEVR